MRILDPDHQRELGYLFPTEVAGSATGLGIALQENVTKLQVGMSAQFPLQRDVAKAAN